MKSYYKKPCKFVQLSVLTSKIKKKKYLIALKIINSNKKNTLFFTYSIYRIDKKKMKK